MIGKSNKRKAIGINNSKTRQAKKVSSPRKRRDNKSLILMRSMQSAFIMARRATVRGILFNSRERCQVRVTPQVSL